MEIPSKSLSRIQSLFVRSRLQWRDPSTILLSVALGVIVLTFQDYGITWDESARNAYGHHVLNYYLSFSQDTSALHVGNLYGGLFDGLAAAVQVMSPFGHYETRHLLNAICGWLTLIGVMKLGSLVGGPCGGFFAVLFLLLSPRFYGHMFNNPKDVPFAMGYLWSVYYLVRTLPHWPPIPTSLVFKLGIAIGLALGVRVGGLLLIAYLLMIWGLTLLYQFRERNGAGLHEALRKGGGSCLQGVLIAWTVMLVAWPWAQGSLLRPFQALEEMAHFSWNNEVLFKGAQITASELPRSYFLHLMAITTPEIVLASLALGGIALCFWQRGFLTQKKELLVILFAGLFPIAYIMWNHSVLYDGIRHLLFVVVTLTLLAGIFLGQALHWQLRRSGRLAQSAALFILTPLCVVQIAYMVHLHPHQYVYFNSLTGGLPGAYGQYETDYWGNSYKEAVNWLEEFILMRDGNAPQDYTVLACSDPLSSDYFFPDFLSWSQNARKADFFIATTRDNCHKRGPAGVLLHSVKRFGVPLNVIMDISQEGT